MDFGSLSASLAFSELTHLVRPSLEALIVKICDTSSNEEYIYYILVCVWLLRYGIRPKD